MDEQRLFAVVLAAGSASRFGATKQLADYVGKPLVQRAVRLAEAVCPQRTLLVTGNDWQRVHAAAAPLAGFFIHNERYKQGMGGSIASAVRAVAETSDAVLLLLADQPRISEEYLRKMIATWLASKQKIIASNYADTIGPPALFPARYFGELIRLEGDRGAKTLLEEHRQQVVALSCDEAACDIDTIEDLNDLQSRAT